MFARISFVVGIFLLMLTLGNIQVTFFPKNILMAIGIVTIAIIIAIIVGKKSKSWAWFSICAFTGCLGIIVGALSI